MRNYITLASGCLLFTAALHAQNKPALITETWNSHPAVSAPAQHSAESAVIMMDKRRIEYIDDKTDMFMYRTLHKIVHLNDDKGIEAFNRIYLPVYNTDDIIDIKARTILPGGKVIELDKKNIKDLKEDETLYKIFAMEGLVKGCDVEFYYTYKTDFSYFGREVLQSGLPVVSTQVEVVAPARLVFDVKGYNGLPASTDTVLNDKWIATIQTGNIAAAEEEKYSVYRNNLKRVDYKLSYNKSKNAAERLFTWNDLAKRAYTMHTTFSDKELKKAENLINDAGWKNLSGERAIVIAVEDYLKKNFSSRDDIDNEESENLEWIIKNKMASPRGMTRLFIAIFNKLGVAYELVLCGARDEYTLDRSLENWSNCNNRLLYFPALKKFISPVAPELRYPWFDPFWGATEGIYCKATTIGNFTTAIASFKTVPLEDFQQTHLNLEVAAKLDASLDTLLVDAKEICTGYGARYYRAAFNFNSAEDQQKLIKEIVKNGTHTENIVSYKIENQDFGSYPDNKPVIFSTSVKSTELLERAGKKLLVKMGDLIGPQAEMYQEKARQFPLEIGYPHILDRTLQLEIPAGYVAKNPEDFAMKQLQQENGETVSGFVSTYTLEGNLLKIHVREEYKSTRYSLEGYEAFRAVINAAADFNKKVLVLEKK